MRTERSRRGFVSVLFFGISLLLASAILSGAPADSPHSARKTARSAQAAQMETSPAGAPEGAGAPARAETAGPAPNAPALTATKGVDKASASLGDTLSYTVTINNTGTDATGVSFSDTLDTNLTFVPGSLQVSPIAVNDAYNCTGNLSISVPAGVGVLANDYLGQNPAATISAFDAASVNGGAVSMAADGSFTYEPPAGYTGTDIFTYTLLNTTGASAATVSVTVSAMIWFVDNAAGACSSSCDGRLSHPFTSLAAFIAAGSGNMGDKIFIYSGSGPYAGNLSLKLNQRLIGQGDPLNATTLGFTPAPYGPALPAAAAKPTLTGSLALANGVTVLAVDWVTNSMLTISGVGVTGVTIGDQCTVTANGGLALYLNNADGNFTFRSISANGNQGGIIWNNSVQATGRLTVTGDGVTAGSGGTIHDVWGSDGDGMGYGCGVYLNKASNVSLSWMNLYNFQNYAVRGLSVNNFIMDQCAITGTSGNNAAYYEGCVSFGSTTGDPGGAANGLTGSATISNCTITGGITDNVRVANQSGTLNRLTLSSDTISTAGNNGVFVQGESSAVVNVTATGCNISSVYGDHLRFLMNGANTANLNFQNNTLSNPAPFGTTGSGGITLISGNNAGGANTTFTISYNTSTGARADAIHVEKRLDPGTLSGSVARNEIGVEGTANSGSATGSGIWVQNAGLGTVTANLAYNEIYQYNRDGITIQAGGSTASGGALNVTLTNNWAWSAGNGGGLINGLYVKAGTIPGDSFAVCADSKGTGLQGSSASGGGYGLIFAQRMATTVTVPGYTGANNDNAALTTYEHGINSGTFTTFASNTVGSGGGGFVGGIACPQPSTFVIPVSGDGAARDERLAPLTDGQTAPLVQEALVRLAIAGIEPARLARLEKIRVRIGDLPAGLVAEVYPEEIVVDRLAAGRGWFVDPTPYDDAEFEEVLPDGSVRAGEDSQARPGVDLLSVLLAAFANEVTVEPAGMEGTQPDRAMDPAPAGEPAAPAVTEAVRRLLEFLPETGVRCLPVFQRPQEPSQTEAVSSDPPAAHAAAAAAPPKAGSPAKSGETVTVAIGALPGNKGVIIKFAATIGNPLSVPAAQVTNQGTVSGSNFSTLLTNIATTTISCPGVPAVTGISPSQGPQVGGATVTLTGSGFLGATAVTFGATPAASYLVNGDTSITAVSPPGTGIVDIRVSTPCDTSAATPADQFAYRPAPVVISVLPPAGPEAGGTVVTITGSGFTGATAVTFGPTPAAFTFIDDSTIQAVTPPGGGTVEVHVTTPGGTSAANPPLDRFTYLPVPVLYSVFPSAGPQTGGTTVNLTGSGFTGATSVNFGATPALSYLVSSDITITAVSPPGTGTVDVIVTTPGGTSAVTSADRFTYFQVPVVLGVVPSSGPQAGGTTVVVTGTGFTGASAVRFGATPAAFIVLNDTTVQATSPPGSGVVDILVTTPGGTSVATPADRFTYFPVPLVTGVLPSYGPQTGGSTVSITGIGFTGATSVSFGATPAAFVVVNDTTVQATSPPGFGNVDVRVTTPGGTSAATPSDLFIYCPIPIVMSVLPPLGPQAGGTTVTINGIGFMGAAAVNFGATPAASFWLVNDSTIQAVSPPGTGTVDVTVTTPGGTSAVTSADRFTYCPAITLSPATLPGGTKGVAYSQTITAAGGTGSYTFAVTSGALPDGLSLDTSGALTGSPSVPNTFSFTVTATDSSGCTGSQAYSLTIACATVVTNLNDSGAGSLRWAVANACVGGTITFAPGLTGVIQLTSGSIPTTFDLTIQGPGASVVAVDGGGLDRVFNHVAGTLAISGLTLRNGSASVHGGGIYASAPLSLTDCVVSGCNTSTGTNAGGGGIYAQAGLTMDRCTVSGNQMTGGGYGGGLEVNVMPGVLTNCTFSGNHAPGSGGGVMIANTTCTLLNCTVTQNSVPSVNPGGGIAVINGTLNYQNSIVAGNGGQAGLQIFNSASTVNDNGGNLTSGDPLVAPLADYGGPTPTHALVCGSPALDAAVPGTYPQSDQRLVPRPQGANGDTGAFENMISLSPATLPAGQVGTAYDQTLAATGGTGTHAFTTADTLPTGLTLASDGHITGTPTALGSWSFIVVARDADGMAGACRYTIDVACPAITVTNPAVTSGTVNAAFSQVFTQSGGVAPVTFSTTSALPAGLALAADGTLSGTPTAAGTFTITVTAEDANDCTGTGPVYTLIIGCQTITVTNPTVTTGTVNAAFSQTFTQSGGIAPVTFSTTSTLPAGLTLASNGTLSGTPTQTGTFPITVTAKDANDCTGSGPVYTLVIGCQTITVTNPTVTTGTVNAAFSQTFTQSGGIAPVTFSTASTLPAGLTLAANGTLSGTPTVTGTFPITVTVEDDNDCTGTGPVYMLVIGCQAITVTNPTVTTGTVSAFFSQTFTQSGGIAPVTFSTTSTLPAGLTLAANGTLSGTPTQTGTFNIAVTAKDANDCTGTGSVYTLVIGCQTITVTNPTVTTGTVNAFFSQTFTQSGGIAPVTFSTASTLPAGLTFASNGTLSGTPTQTGTFTITVTAKDANNCTGTGSVYTLVIGCQTIAVSPSTLPAGTVGAPYGPVTFTQAGGVGTIAWTQTGTLPTGVTFNAATATLSGTPTQTGSFPITVTARDANLCAGSRDLTLMIGCPGILLTPASLPAATVGFLYSQTLTASGGTGPYTFAVGAGLPAGVTLSPAGLLSGTPCLSGMYTFNVTATDLYRCSVSLPYTLAVNCPAITVASNPSPLPTGQAGVPYGPVTFTAAPALSCGAYVYSLSSGSVPGLTLDPATGVLSGTPSQPGAFTFTVRATLASSPACYGEQTFTVSFWAFDLSLYDDTNRSQLCLNTTTGDFQYKILRGTLAGTVYRGRVTFSQSPDGNLSFSTSPVAAVALTGNYMIQKHRAAALLRDPSRMLNSELNDTDTTDDARCK